MVSSFTSSTSPEKSSNGFFHTFNVCLV
jgi:hypothetical protein